MGYFTVRVFRFDTYRRLITRSVFLTTIPLIFREIYHQPPGIAGLNYIALGIGLTLTSQINARVLDRVYKHFKIRNGGVGEPEFRLRKFYMLFSGGRIG